MIKNSYSFWGYLRLAIFVIRTKFISSKARIIRFPIEIRGKRFIDLPSIDFGDKISLEALNFETDEFEIYESMEDIWPDYPRKDDFLFNEEEY